MIVREKDASEHREYEGIPWRQQLINLSFQKMTTISAIDQLMHSWPYEFDHKFHFIEPTGNIKYFHGPPQTRFPTLVQDHLWGSQLHWRWGGHTDPRLDLGLDLATGLEQAGRWWVHLCTQGGIGWLVGSFFGGNHWWCFSFRFSLCLPTIHFHNTCGQRSLHESGEPTDQRFHQTNTHSCSHKWYAKPWPKLKGLWQLSGHWSFGPQPKC